MSDEPTLAQSIQVAKEASAFDDLYRRATASVGGYYMGIYVIATRESGTFYFLPYEETRGRKTFKGLHVVQYPDKRKPNKATVAFRGLEGAKVQPANVPADVLERFAEAASKL